MPSSALTLFGSATTLGYFFPLHRHYMAYAWLLKNLLGNLLLPPTNAFLLLAIAGVFRRRRWALGLALFAGVGLLAQSLPPVAAALIATLEERAGPVISDPGDAQAIIVLGSGLNLAAEEYGGDTATDRSLIRLRYAATLARRYQLPLLVSGGKPRLATRAEAEVIGGILEKEFAVPVRWREMQSHDTAENAIFSARILQPEGIRRVVLVTQAFHMPRARRLFAAAGFDVIPAPTDFRGRRPDHAGPFDWLPQARALHTSYYALHEWLGLAWIELSTLSALKP